MGEFFNAAEGIVKILKEEQISKVFCVPGESYLPLLDSLYEEPSIEVITCRHEGGASFMAESYAKSTNRPGVVMATRAVGAANLSIGVHTAYQDSTPLIVLLGQVHSRFRGREGFQEVDLDRFFSHIAKWAVEIHDPKRIPEIFSRAIRISRSGRPGPVVISLPEDVFERKVEMVFGPPFRKSTPSPSREEVSEFERLLSSAKKPLILAGGGVKLADGEEELVKFAETYQLPVITSFRRHDVFPNLHPLYAGQLGLGTPKGVLETVKEADCLMVFGSRLSEVTTQDYRIISPEKTLIHIDISDDTIGKVYPPHLGIIADIKGALKSLLTLKVNVTWSDWAKKRHEVYLKESTIQKPKNLYEEIIAILDKKLQ